MTYLPAGTKPDLAADQWQNAAAQAVLSNEQLARQADALRPWNPTPEDLAEIHRRAQNTPRPRAASPDSWVVRAPPGPKAEAWLRKHNGPYREARERQERDAERLLTVTPN